MCGCESQKANNEGPRKHNTFLPIVNWIDSMLANRILMIEEERYLICESVDSGCLQGGVLLPLLWTLEIDDLLKEIIYI